ncbi:MAG: ornithine carbamoyltransferase [candidate division NC10 bacterium]|nr:ornithine carbamoyltransferase [candidate division NC10 bacterium]
MKKDLLSIHDLSLSEIEGIFELAAELKARQKRGERYTPLMGKTLAMIFEKPSTRTRVSFEVGMHQLGGHALFLNPRDIQLGRVETVADTARVLSRYVDGILIRTYSQERVEELACHSSVPVINGLSDLTHPCQILADLFTVKEKRGELKGLKVAYIGDGNNVAHSWLYGAAKTGIDLSIARPRGFGPDEGVLSKALKDAEASGARLKVMDDPIQAAKGADVLYTDVWASMGQEEEHAKRVKAFKGFQVNQGLVAIAKRDVLVMHCLPAHRDEEITDEVLDGPHSIVLDQAENRLHVQKAILVKLLG